MSILSPQFSSFSVFQVDMEINGEPVDLHMKLGDNGEAFFVQETENARVCLSVMAVALWIYSYENKIQVKTDLVRPPRKPRHAHVYNQEALPKPSSCRHTVMAVKTGSDFVRSWRCSQEFSSLPFCLKSIPQLVLNAAFTGSVSLTQIKSFGLMTEEKPRLYANKSRTCFYQFYRAT